MRDRLLRAAFALLWLLALTGCLFLTLRTLINDQGYFKRGYERLDMLSRIGISDSDCAKALARMIAYMEGREASIQLTVTENGRPVEMFNEQEIAHMVDVRALYQAWRGVMYAGLAALSALLAALAVKRTRALAWRGLWLAWTALLALSLVLGAWVLADFNSFWTNFHYLFFDNELWLMDPAVCRMIRICPIELFYGIVVRTGAVFLTAFGLLPAVCALAVKKSARKERL